MLSIFKECPWLKKMSNFLLLTAFKGCQQGGLWVELWDISLAISHDSSWHVIPRNMGSCASLEPSRWTSTTAKAQRTRGAARGRVVSWSGVCTWNRRDRGTGLTRRMPRVPWCLGESTERSGLGETRDIFLIKMIITTTKATLYEEQLGCLCYCRINFSVH